MVTVTEGEVKAKISLTPQHHGHLTLVSHGRVLFDDDIGPCEASDLAFIAGEEAVRMNSMMRLSKGARRSA